MKHLSIVTHFAAAIIITILLFTVYAAVHHSYCSSANDQQIGIARDSSDALSKRKSIIHLIPADTIGIEKSLAVFAEIVDKKGKPLQSPGFLNGSFYLPPAGKFDFTNTNEEDIITWQPQSDVCMAMVLINDPGEEFVAAGRSLKETEMKERNFSIMLGIAWIACIGILLVHLLIQVYCFKRIAKTKK